MESTIKTSNINEPKKSLIYEIFSARSRNDILKMVLACAAISNILLGIWAFYKELYILFNSNLRPMLSLVVIVTSGILGGQAAIELGQDSMLGMLFAGVVMRNLFSSLIVTIPHCWTSVMWTLALCSVISRAGLSLQKTKVMSNLKESIMLGFIPVLIEAFFMGYLSKWLFGLPGPWAFTLAFGIACISPGVVVPLILKLVDDGWAKSRLPPLLLTALGLDVLIGTAGFGIALSACSPDASANSWVFQGIKELVVGGLLGGLQALVVLLYGKFKFPEQTSVILIFISSSCCMIWCKTNGYTGAASFSTFITWSTVANTWSRQDIEKSDQKLKVVWLNLKPFLFPVIGATVSFYDIPLWELCKATIAVLLSMSVKMVSAYTVGRTAGLDREEASFLSGLWTGKASIQATLSNAALELVHHGNFAEDGPENGYAKLIFLCMVCSIVLGVSTASTWVQVYGRNPVGLKGGTLLDESLSSQKGEN